MRKSEISNYYKIDYFKSSLRFSCKWHSCPEISDRPLTPATRAKLCLTTSLQPKLTPKTIFVMKSKWSFFKVLLLKFWQSASDNQTSVVFLPKSRKGPFRAILMSEQNVSVSIHFQVNWNIIWNSKLPRVSKLQYVLTTWKKKLNWSVVCVFYTVCDYSNGLCLGLLGNLTLDDVPLRISGLRR